MDEKKTDRQGGECSTFPPFNSSISTGRKLDVLRLWRGCEAPRNVAGNRRAEFQERTCVLSSNLFAARWAQGVAKKVLSLGRKLTVSRLWRRGDEMTIIPYRPVGMRPRRRRRVARGQSPSLRSKSPEVAPHRETVSSRVSRKRPAFKKKRICSYPS